MKPKRIRIKSCEVCDRVADTRYRIQTDPAEGWFFACGRCLVRLKAAHPEYRYGGTWKAKKRH